MCYNNGQQLLLDLGYSISFDVDCGNNEMFIKYDNSDTKQLIYFDKFAKIYYKTCYNTDEWLGIPCAGSVINMDEHVAINAWLIANKWGIK